MAVGVVFFAVIPVLTMPVTIDQQWPIDPVGATTERLANSEIGPGPFDAKPRLLVSSAPPVRESPGAP